MRPDFWHTAVVNSWLVLWVIWMTSLVNSVQNVFGAGWAWAIGFPGYMALVYGYTAWQTRGTFNAWKNWSKAKPRPYWKVQP